MGQRKESGISKEQALHNLLVKRCNDYESYTRECEIEDAKELINYQAEVVQDIQSQPLVTFQNSVNVNLNLNININHEMTPERLQQLFDIINSSVI